MKLNGLNGWLRMPVELHGCPDCRFDSCPPRRIGRSTSGSQRYSTGYVSPNPCRSKTFITTVWVWRECQQDYIGCQGFDSQAGKPVMAMSCFSGRAAFFWTRLAQARVL